MQNLATPLRPTEPAFLRENWKVYLGSCSDDVAVVRVQDKVATLTSRASMIRCTIDHPDGYYKIGAGNELVPATPGFGAFPDPLSCYQPFDKMTPSRPFSSTMVHMLIQYLEQARRARTTVVLDRRGFMTMGREPLLFDAARWLGEELPLRGEEMAFNPELLKLAFVEMLRYSGQDKERDACCYLCHNWQPERRTPLVIGHRWENCALIMPIGY